jgi:CHAT domain-containing protein/Flp pilus assembly protein TadD
MILEHWIAIAVSFTIFVPLPGSTKESANAEQRWETLRQESADANKTGDDTGDYTDAVARAEKALEFARQAFGDRDRKTLISTNDLALIYFDKLRRYNEAELLWVKLLQTGREAFGPEDESTLTAILNLGVLYAVQNDYGKAEPLLQEALQAHRQVLGPNDPNTLHVLFQLEFVHLQQGHYDKVESLFKEELQVNQRTADVLSRQLRYVGHLIRQNKLGAALWLLQLIEQHVLVPNGPSTDISLQTTYQNAVLTVATRLSSDDARRLAANAILRFKLFQSEEERTLARITRRSNDPRVRALDKELVELRVSLAGALARAQDPDVVREMLWTLRKKQLELDGLARNEGPQSETMATLDDLRRALPTEAVLVAFRQFFPIVFEDGTEEESHFAALLLTTSTDPMVIDLGPIKLPFSTNRPIVDDETAAKLYQQLFGKFDRELAAATTVYLAPDDILNRIPFARLRLADGRYWVERQELRMLQSAHVLLGRRYDDQARGLLALGDIDFGPIVRSKKGTSVLSVERDPSLDTLIIEEGTTPGSFSRLIGSRDEVKKIEQTYKLLRKEESTEVWLGSEARKARLVGVKSVPRVLHLATHAFYFPHPFDQRLGAGLALAGANRNANGSDGILSALEVQDLKLDGNELVVLSACDTAQGSTDHSAGFYGLVRALHIAGAQNVLVTLWPVNDRAARDFMAAFYKTWLSRSQSDPARALRDTQLSYINGDNTRDPGIWAPYLLIE